MALSMLKVADPCFRAVVLNLFSLRSGKVSKQILRTGGPSKINPKVCNLKAKNGNFNLMRNLLLSFCYHTWFYWSFCKAKYSVDFHITSLFGLWWEITMKSFSQIGKLHKKISSNFMALSLSSEYSFLSDIQNCENGKSLCLDNNVVSQ